MRTTPLEQKIADLAAPVVQEMGLALFAVRIIGDGGSRTVQIMAENLATRNISIDQCATISRSVSALLDVEDVIQGSYRLEVSSPGIDRLLLEPDHFRAYEGFEAKVETDRPNAMGQRRFKGTLTGIDNDIVRMDTEQGTAEIPLANIAKAKLVLNDKLLKSTANRTDSLN